MKHQRSEEALNFIKQKKDLLIIVGMVIAVAVLAILSFNYLNEQKQIDARIAFGEAFSQGQDENATIESLQAVAQEYAGSNYATYSYMLLGLDFLDKKEYREAIVAFESALKSKQSAPFLTAMLWELKGIAFEFDGSVDDAISAFNKSLSVPNNYYKRNEVLLKTALLNLKIGQNAEARKIFEEIIADSTTNDNIKRVAKNEIAALEQYGY